MVGGVSTTNRKGAPSRKVCVVSSQNGSGKQQMCTPLPLPLPPPPISLAARLGASSPTVAAVGCGATDAHAASLAGAQPSPKIRDRTVRRNHRRLEGPAQSPPFGRRGAITVVWEGTEKTHPPKRPQREE